MTSFDQAIRQTTIRGDYRDNSLTWSFASESFDRLTGLSDKLSANGLPNWNAYLYLDKSYYVCGFFDTGSEIHTHSNMSYEAILRLSFLLRKRKTLCIVLRLS